jgi:hypothetical protein
LDGIEVVKTLGHMLGTTQLFEIEGVAGIATLNNMIIESHEDIAAIVRVRFRPGSAVEIIPIISVFLNDLVGSADHWN